MRIFSYTLLDGGEGRADPLAEVIAAQSADVVGLLEAENEEVLARIARRLKMDYVQAMGGHGTGVALLSRFAIRDSINHGALHPDVLKKGFLQATVVDGGGASWHCGVVHLQHKATEEHERIREREIEVVLGALERLRRGGTPHVLMGDFNANSPHQCIDLDRCKPSTREQVVKNGGTVPRRVIGRVMDAGYVDTFHELFPVEAQVEGTFTTQFPGQRVDYVFTHSFPRNRLKKAWIETDRLAKYASDHFAVGSEVE